MLYSFKGLDGSGKNKSGTIDASGLKEARGRLRVDGIYVTDIREESVSAKKGSLSLSFQFSVPPKELASFFRQTASLLTAGIPLMETLTATEEQSDSSKLTKIINEIKNDVRQGDPLATAMEKHSAVFDSLTTSMVQAGETGGNLAEVLSRIADYKETALRRDSAIKSATVYPMTMFVIGIGVIIFLVTYVVPKIIVIFDDLEQALPLSTTILIAVTKFFTSYGYIMGIASVIGLVLLSRFLLTDAGKWVRDRTLLKLPVVGPLVKASVLARWSHTTSVLLASGVPLLQTLKLSQEVADNKVYASAIEKASDEIREGGSIAKSLAQSKLFPPVVLQMVGAGEKSGQSPELLRQVARDQSAELENRIAVLMSLVQPALIIVLGSIIGFIVMAILLPIFEISQLIG